MRTKRVAIVTPYGAAPRYDNYAEFILAQVLRERGWDARMYTYAARGIPGHRTDQVYEGVSATRCRERFGISPKLLFSLLRFRPSTIMCFHPKNMLSFSSMLAARILRARFVVEVVGILHDPYIVRDVDDPTSTMREKPELITTLSELGRRVRREPILGAWKNYILHAPTAHADIVVAINDEERGLVSKIYNRDAERIYYATPRLRGEQSMKPPAGVERIPADYLFFIGQVKRRKGWDTALSALAVLKRAGKSPHLVFVTPDADHSEAVAFAEKEEILDDVTFLSAVTNEEKNWLYAHAKYVLVPSTYEGFGLPVFEAFLARKPVCATDIPVFREFLTHRKNAMLSPVGDGDGLARSVMELDADSGLRGHLSDAGILTANDFNFERMVEGHLKVLV